MQRRGLGGLGWWALAVAVALASPAWNRPLTRQTHALHGVTGSSQRAAAATGWLGPSLDDDDSAPLDWVARSSSRMPRELRDAHRQTVSAQPVRMDSRDSVPVTFARRKVPAHADDAADPDCPASLH